MSKRSKKTSSCRSCSFLCMITKAPDKYLKEGLRTRSLDELVLRLQARRRKANAQPPPKALNQLMFTRQERSKILIIRKRVQGQDGEEVKLLPNQQKSPETIVLFQTMKIWRPTQFRGQELIRASVRQRIVVRTIL